MKVVGPSEKVLLINEVGTKGRVVSGLMVVSNTSEVDVVDVDVVVVVEVSEPCAPLQLIMKEVAAITATTAELFIF